MTTDSNKETRSNKNVLTRHAPSRVATVAEAEVLKNEDLFFLANRDGSVPQSKGHGLGLYYHDCRYLNGVQLLVAGKKPRPLAAIASSGFEGIFQLTNGRAEFAKGRVIPEETIGIEWRRVLEHESPVMHELITFHNYSGDSLSLPLSLSYSSDFEDVLEVRGLYPEQRRAIDSSWEANELRFSHRGSDGLLRALSIQFADPPDEVHGSEVVYHLELPARGQRVIRLFLRAIETSSPERLPDTAQHNELERIHQEQFQKSGQWLAERTRLVSGSWALDQAMKRSLIDLHMLRTTLGTRSFYAAGVPWFSTLFGRDSLITALQTLALDYTIARETLLLLAGYQGTKVDDWRDEQPGKISHELRVGELTRSGKVPYSPYYGSVDATALFLIVLCEYIDWSNDTGILEELSGNIERALQWLDVYGALRDGGFIQYSTRTDEGIINQAWKDSGNSVVNPDGSIASLPYALVEVQGYAYDAKRRMARLFRRLGRTGDAEQLDAQAAALRERFNQRYWLSDKNFYALAIADGAPLSVISSNPGHALWSGIVDERRAGTVVQRLLEDDMHSGWGIRTLSSREQAYNPVGYHLGTVWPHDNSLIAAGFRRYGFDGEAVRLFDGIFQAATYFEGSRLPEVFSGFGRDDYPTPVPYPVACHPQAWAAGALPFMLFTLLGLFPDAAERKLTIRRPCLPNNVRTLTVHALKVADVELDLRVDRTETGAFAVEVLRRTGDLEVLIEPGTASQRSTLRP